MMPVEDLNAAIQYIQQGQPEKARPILQALIQANQQDLMAWSWYVKSCATPEQRLKALELCLRFNPGNEQVSAAIDKLRARLVAQQPPAALPASTPAAVQPFSSTSGYYENAYQASEPPAAAAPIAQAGAPDTPSTEAGGLLFPDEPESQPFPWYEVWLKALTQVNAPSYFELLRDPTADPGRAYMWLFIANLLAGAVLFLSVVFLGSGILSSLKQSGVVPDSEFQPGTLYPVLLLLIPVGSALNVFGTVLAAAIYSFIARMMGGTGNFARTIYLMGAYTAPVTIIESILSLIPLVSCLNLPLALYSFWMNICAIQVAHRMPTSGRAAMVILIPALLEVIILCVIFFAGSQYFMELIRSQAGGH